jgi:hypothetical protein
MRLADLNWAVMGALDSSLRPRQYTYLLNGHPIFTECDTPSNTPGWSPMGVSGLMQAMGITLNGRPREQRTNQNHHKLTWTIALEGRPGVFSIVTAPAKFTLRPTHRLDYFFGSTPYFTEKATTRTPTAADGFLKWMGYRRGVELPRMPLQGDGYKVIIPLVGIKDGTQGIMMMVDMVPLR